ncbi:MAG: hypothetical protein LBL74_04925 [Bacteroidales bacterium]|jgi:hypothetical protein|nr:hypothetical protein [Bacteroidales bacterium]
MKEILLKRLLSKTLAIMFAATISVAMVGCSDDEENTNPNTQIPNNAKEIAFVNDKGEIQLEFSQDKVISAFNTKNKGQQLRVIDIYDDAPTSLTSNASLVLNIYDLEKKTYVTFALGKIIKAIDNGIIRYYHSTNNPNKVAGPTIWIGCEAKENCTECHPPQTTKYKTYSCKCKLPSDKGTCSVRSKQTDLSAIQGPL